MDILIVGASIAGPTLASFLQLATRNDKTFHPHITVLERASSMRSQGQNIDVRGSGVEIIKRLGIETIVRQSTTGEKGVQWVDDDNRVWGQFGIEKAGQRQGPTADIEVMRGRLAEICWKRSTSLGGDVEYIFGDTLQTIDQIGDKVRVKFTKSKTVREFDLLVGADGLQSSVRRLVWSDDEVDFQRLGMYGGFFSMPSAPTDTEFRRWWHAPGRRGIMTRPHPRPGRTSALLYVMNDDPRLVDLAGSRDVKAQRELLASYFCGEGWECDRVIKEMMTTEDFYYDAVAQVKMQKWSKGRVVLLGDAGYCASPLSGMGTTLAMTGAYYLAGALTRNPTDYTAAFAEYEQNLRPLVGKAHKLVPGAPHILSAETAWGVWFANFVTWSLSASGFIKILIQLIGPGAKETPLVEEYGIPNAEELEQA